MSKIDEVIERIRKLASRYSGSVPMDLAEVQDAYAQAVEEVNARLERCVQLIRNGRRSEALHMADLSPSVLDQAAALDFPELTRWQEICAECGGGALPSVNADAVSEINEAYPQEQKLERLLRAHRRLALGRGPLRERIKVLRLLSAADSETPAWSQDLVEFEKARHAALQRAAITAHARGDMMGLKGLYQETCKDAWLEKPSKAIRVQVERLYGELRGKTIRTQLTAVEKKLIAAYQEQDIARVSTLLEQWDQVSAMLGPIGTVESPQVDDVRAWIAQQHETAAKQEDFDHTCAAMESALEERKPLDEIERLWAVLSLTEMPIPDSLRTRYEARVHEKQLEHTRRFRLVLVGVVGLILVLAGAVGALIHWNAGRNRITRWQQQVAQQIEKQQYDGARQVLDRLAKEDATTFNAPEIQTLKVKLGELTKAEELQTQRFNQELARVKAAGLDANADDFDQLASLAKSDAEKLQAGQARAAIEQARQARQAKIDQSFSSALDDLRKRFEELKGQASTADIHTLAGLRAVYSGVLNLLESPGISSPMVASGKTLGASVKSFTDSYADRLKRLDASTVDLQHIQTLFNNPADLAKAEAAFAQKYPDHPLAKEFMESAKLKAGWDSVEAWRSLADSGRPTDATSIKAMLDKIKPLADQTPPGVFTAALGRYARYLERAEAASNAGAGGGTDLQAILHHKLIENVYVVRGRGGQVFYMGPDEKPQVLPNDNVMLHYFATADQAFGNSPAQEKLLDGSAVPADPTPALSPQSQFARAASAWLVTSGDKWQTRYLHLCKMLMAQPGMDAVLRLQLARQLAHMSTNSDALELKPLDDWLKMADKLDLDVPWLDPFSADANTGRTRAEAALALAPDFAKLESQTHEAIVSLLGELKPGKPIGLIWRQGQDMTVWTPSGTLQPGQLDVVTAAPGGGWRFVPLAQVDGQEHPTWATGAVSNPAGSIIYEQAGSTPAISGNTP